MEAAQKVALEPLASALGVAAFLHNVIIVHPIISLVAGCFFMHYNATLCKEAWEKNYWRKLRSIRVFSKNCASNFFLSVGKGVASEM
jgi:hypothetical protein